MKNSCIINFHGVRSQRNNSLNNRHLPAGEFEKMILYLSTNFRVVSLKKLFDDFREKKEITKKTIALTFDDGYLNNFEVALPILKKYNVPATFYIISKSLQEENYLAWPDKVDFLKLSCCANISLNNISFKPPKYYSEEVKMELASYLKTLGMRTDLEATKLFERCAVDPEVLKSNQQLFELINVEKIRHYANEPLIEFGSHSHSHCNMEYLSAEDAMSELTRSKELVENSIGKKIISFAFPDGSYRPETVEYAKKAGYENIVAVEYRFNEENKNPNLLSRFTISNSTTSKSNILRLAMDFDKFGF